VEIITLLTFKKTNPKDPKIKVLKIVIIHSLPCHSKHILHIETKKMKLILFQQVAKAIFLIFICVVLPAK